MDRSIAMLLIGLVFGGGVGFVVAASQGVTLDGHNHADPTHHATAEQAGVISPDNRCATPASMPHAHHGPPLEIAAGPTAPSLNLTLSPDPSSGWNLHAAVTNFQFAPENASCAHMPGQGHAHVYVNDVKVARLYGPWFHLSDLPKGAVRITVGLYANDHRPLQVGSDLLSQVITVQNN